MWFTAMSPQCCSSTEHLATARAGNNSVQHHETAPAAALGMQEVSRAESFWWKPSAALNCWGGYTGTLWGCANTPVDLARSVFLWKQISSCTSEHRQRTRSPTRSHWHSELGPLLLCSSDGKVTHLSYCWWLVFHRDATVDEWLNSTVQTLTLYLPSLELFLSP